MKEGSIQYLSDVSHFLALEFYCSQVAIIIVTFQFGASGTRAKIVFLKSVDDAVAKCALMATSENQGKQLLRS